MSLQISLESRYMRWTTCSPFISLLSKEFGSFSIVFRYTMLPLWWLLWPTAKKYGIISLQAYGWRQNACFARTYIIIRSKALLQILNGFLFSDKQSQSNLRHRYFRTNNSGHDATDQSNRLGIVFIFGRNCDQYII